MIFYKALISQGYGDSQLVKNELITEKELRYKFNNKQNLQNLKKVNVKLTNTYWFFGARFEK